uniref:Spermatogenesis associated 16 n=1 Tax=Electrophorus electricus TaxID=8005 RepID=A0A4W4HN20_ELEEL
MLQVAPFPPGRDNFSGRPNLNVPKSTVTLSAFKMPGPSPAGDPTSAVTPAPKNGSPGKRKRRGAGGGASRGETSLAGRADRAGVRRGSALLLSHIFSKTLLDAEMELVFGDERSTAQRLGDTMASSTPPLKCRRREGVGPPSEPRLPQIDEWLCTALRAAELSYRRKKYAHAAGGLSAALQLCTKGAMFGELVSPDYEDVTKAASCIESRLASCYLRMKNPDLALQHSLRSIQMNPMSSRTHLQQAMAYRLLGKPCRAVRSAMIADFVHWLSRATKPHISKLIKLYWQGLLEESISMEEDFSVLYTPSAKDTKQKVVRRQHVKVMGTHTLTPKTQSVPWFSPPSDPCGGHLLPQTTIWSESSSQRYVLTLGFRRSQDGDFLDKLLHRKCPTFTGTIVHPSAFGRRILPVLDFIACTKLVGFSAGSGLIERLQYADCLLQLSRSRVHTLELQHALAELAVAPYLQELSPSDTTLLQALMADITDTLEGKQTDRERVWNAMQKQEDASLVFAVMSVTITRRF